MTFKEVQTALKALGIKKTIQEIGDFFAQHNLDIEVIKLEDVLAKFQYAQQSSTRNKNVKEKAEDYKGIKLLGEYYALKSDEDFYVVFLSKPQMVKLYRCDSLYQAEMIANWLNNVPHQ